MRSVPAMEGTTAAPMFQPIGGIDNFPKGFQKKLGEKIQLNSEVVSIRQSEDSVKVAYKNTKTGAVKEITADYCISCLPLTILRNMEVNISPELMTAVKNTPYSPSAKIGLQMKRRFWEEDDHIFGGHLYSNLPIGEFSYPSYDYFTKKGVLLGLYSNGPIGTLAAQPIAAMCACANTLVRTKPGRMCATLSIPSSTLTYLRTSFWLKSLDARNRYCSAVASNCALILSMISRTLSRLLLLERV